MKTFPPPTMCKARGSEGELGEARWLPKPPPITISTSNRIIHISVNVQPGTQGTKTMCKVCTKPCETKRHHVPPWVRQLDSLGVSPCWLVRRRRGAHSGCELAKRAINPGILSPSPPFPTFLPSLGTTLGIMNTLFPLSPVCAGYCSCSFGT